MNQIYALLDRELIRQSGLEISEIARQLEKLRIPVAQYRDKEGSSARIYEALSQLRQFYSGTLIVNDRLDLVELADGVHLGQEDLAAVDSAPAKALGKIRERIGRKLLGLSTHNLQEIETANTLDLDYIGLGAYRPTSTKSDAEVQGDTLLRIARASRHPVAIIGGVRWEDEFEEPIRWKVLGSALFERIRHP